MAAGDIPTLLGSETAPSITLNSLADGDAAVSAAISANISGSLYYPRYYFRLAISTNQSTAPDDDTLIGVYLSRYFNSAYDGGLSAGTNVTADAGVETLERTLTPLKAVAVLGDGTSEV